MGEALHVGRNIVLLHQVVPHGAGLADVLTDLHQFAHHLRVTSGCVPGNVKTEKSERNSDGEMRGSMSEQHLWRQLRLGEIRAEMGLGRILTGHQRWHIYKLP